MKRILSVALIASLAVAPMQSFAGEKNLQSFWEEKKTEVILACASVVVIAGRILVEFLEHVKNQ